MNFSAMLLLVAVMQVSASSMGQTVSINVKNTPVSSVLKAIRHQTGYDFFYSKDLLKDARMISLSCNNVAIEKVLDSCLSGLPITYEIKNNVVLFRKKEDIAAPVDFSIPPITLKGRITDSTGTPLKGATIRLRKTPNVIGTDGNGEFTLSGLKSGDVIIISFVGYQTREIIVTGESTNYLNIVLKAEINKLTEIAVVSNGYQTLPKERSAGAFGKPDMSLVYERSFSVNILQRLDGLVPGLVINNSPSASQNPILIRGLTTVGTEVLPGLGIYGNGTNRNPLYVVDGIPINDINTINPQDVADVTVLKDATAASIWGARAANGVIVINTKKGSTGGRLRVQYDAFLNYQGKPNTNYYPGMNSRDFIKNAEEIFDPETYPWESLTSYPLSGMPPHEVILYNRYRGIISNDQATKSLDSLSAIDNRKQIKDLLYANALLSNQTISVTGGNKLYSFYGSLAYTRNTGYQPGNNTNTYKLNLRQEFAAGPHVHFDLVTDLTNTLSSAKRPVTADSRFYPYQLFRDAGGHNLSMPYMGTLSDSIRQDYQDRSGINLDYIPLDELNYGYTKSNQLNARNILNVNISLTKGLSFSGTYGFINGSTRGEAYDDIKSYNMRYELLQFTVAPTAGSTPVYYLPATGGSFATNNSTSRTWTVRNQLNYNNSWDNALHQLSILAGQELQEQQSLANTTQVRGYNRQLQTFSMLDYQTLSTIGVAGTIIPNYGIVSLLSDNYFTQTESISRFRSYFANGAYTYNRKYSINGSFRIDKSNLFGLDQSAQNKPVWSVGAKWIVSDEPFLSRSAWLNNLAFRATYGLSGNAPSPGTSASFDILTRYPSAYLPNGAGLYISSPANRKLSWESTKTINLGVDFSMLNNVLSGTLDLYNKATSNLLGYMPVNALTGYTSVIGNVGDLSNKGVELSLTSNNLKRGSFRWSTMLNMSYNKNKLINVTSAYNTTEGYLRIYQSYVKGYAAYSVFAYQYMGLDNEGDPQIKLKDGTLTKSPYISSTADVQYKGTTQPVVNGGLTNIFNYGNWMLSANAVFNLGHVMRREGNLLYTGDPTHSSFSGDFHSEFANRWKTPGDEKRTNIPSYVADSYTSYSRRDVSYYTYGDINVVSAAYVKLRDISLSYTLPSFILKKLRAEQIALRGQVSNIMLWKANKYGIDPEFQDANNGVLTMPVGQKSFTVGINAKF
ncbi:SusC/RagA family TonB-linked outer membrane protein [Chitinophaga sancti]|uniref:SusC/RagA family TonB-linked outer membrane protein n=1 Tax=Chitinophaga sancti TaxID=1004 RepID=UPI002A76693E|nr:SusC/RagA family TonB-linked outer membrane protein [Chitinophaga sancti]WPQ62686.1 SusC/RagA family TonB-linked outer membrane protein [Chitinophaga sancti]